MSTNKNATIRYLALDRCLRNPGKRYSINDLVEACNEALQDVDPDSSGVKKRQVYEDIKFMQDSRGFDAPVEVIKEGRIAYYRYEDLSFSINNQPLNEQEAQQLKESLLTLGIISGMLTLPSNMFSTVTLPATLWFLDRARQISDFETGKDQISILFVDARNVFHQVDRAHREYEKLFKLTDDKTCKALDKPKDIRLLLDKLNEFSSPVKNNNYVDEEKSPVYFLKMAEWLQQRFPEAKYEDVTGLCKLATIADIEEQDYSLNPGRYVGVVIEEDGMTEEEFEVEIKKLNSELNTLNASASDLEKLINQNVLNLFKE